MKTAFKLSISALFHGKLHLSIHGQPSVQNINVMNTTSSYKTLIAPYPSSSRKTHYLQNKHPTQNKCPQSSSPCKVTYYSSTLTVPVTTCLLKTHHFNAQMARNVKTVCALTFTSCTISWTFLEKLLSKFISQGLKDIFQLITILY